MTVEHYERLLRLPTTWLEREAEAATTNLRVAGIPNEIVTARGWAVINPYSSSCEVLRISGGENRDITLATALAAAHPPGTPIMLVDRPQLNVRWFGAKGDNSTNDATAIQRAIDYAFDGCEITFPEGNYAYQTTPAISGVDHVRFTGMGILKPSGCNGLEIDDCEGVVIDGLRIQGTQGSNTYTGIDVHSQTGNVRHLVIQNCRIQGHKYGIRLRATGGTVYNTRIHDNWIELTSPSIADSIGIWVEQADNKIYNNTIQRYRVSVTLDVGSQLVQGNHFWATSADSPIADIEIRRGKTSKAVGFVIMGNYLDNTPSDGNLVIDVQGADNIVVQGNYFRVTGITTQCILLEATSLWGARWLSIVGNTFANVSGSPVAAIGYDTARTSDSDQFHVFGNNFGSSVEAASTRDHLQTYAHSAGSYVPNAMKGRILEITLSGNITIDEMSNQNKGGVGNTITFVFIQASAGGYTVTWNGDYRQSWSDTGNVTGARSSISFYWDGTNWQQLGAQSPYYS